MKVDFTGRHFTITPAIKKHAKEQLKKIEKVLESQEITSSHFILSVEKYRHRAELLISWRDQSLSSIATTNDMYLALSQATEKMERQALKLKEKLTTIKRKGRGEVKKLVTQEAKETASVPPTPRIVRSRSYAVKPMTPEEAVYNLTALEDQFIVFRNAETDRVGVIYKRKDGHFGLIEP